MDSSPICLPACGAIHKFQLKRERTRYSHKLNGFLHFSSTDCSSAPIGKNGTGGFVPDCGPSHLAMPLNRIRNMKAILVRPDYELYGERQETGDSVSVDIYSVWPHARTDRSPHKIFNINLPKSDMEALADFIKGGTVDV